MSLLLIIACVLLFLAAFGFGWGKYPGLHFGWLGMAFWCLSLFPIPRVSTFHLGFEWVLVVVLVIVIIALLVRPPRT